MITAKGNALVKAEYHIEKNDWEYIRAAIIDEEGRKAWANPIFLK